MAVAGVVVVEPRGRVVGEACEGLRLATLLAQQQVASLALCRVWVAPAVFELVLARTCPQLGAPEVGMGLLGLILCGH